MDNKKTGFFYEKEPSIIFEEDSDKMHPIRKNFKEKILLNDKYPYIQQWKNVVYQALIATTSSVFMPLFVVYITNIDFEFLGLFLLISLSALLILIFLNAFIFKSTVKNYTYHTLGL